MNDAPPGLFPSTEDKGTAYRVLARKYRPTTFAELIGQEAMVRTLSNAFASGRIAHAFILTGVRGIGKTTTARIIARGLNCTGADGQGGPTVTPCGICPSCKALAEDRHVDVIEMDAASRTGVGDIREMIEGVRYKPVLGRYKIYIVDEVHMLSTAAFNALLKTLEEPPPHVKFIFATTEIRKIPITVLSRCQRFDLRRLDAAQIAENLTGIAIKEGAAIDPEAAAMLGRAADGSVRDGQSLLDQAIAMAEGLITPQQVQAMLGLADRTQVWDLFEDVMSGHPAEGLARLQDMYRAGADPGVVLQDMLEVVHWLARLKVAPEASQDPGVAEAEKSRGADLAVRLAMPQVVRAWQILLKGLSETQTAARPLQAAEMVLIRLAYAADLPPPGDLIRQLRDGSVVASGSPPSGGRASPPSSSHPPSGGRTMASGSAGVASAIATKPDLAPGSVLPEPEVQTVAVKDFEAVVALFESRREAKLAAHLKKDIRLVRFEQGQIAVQMDSSAPTTLPRDLARCLSEWTGMRWFVSTAESGGEATLQEQRTVTEKRKREKALQHPNIQAVMNAFPGAIIAEVKPIGSDSSDETQMTETEDSQ